MTVPWTEIEIRSQHSRRIAITSTMGSRNLIATIDTGALVVEEYIQKVRALRYFAPSLDEVPDCPSF